MADFSNLKRKLLDLGETNLEVGNASILKFGCIRLLDFEEPGPSSRYPLVELEKMSSSHQSRKLEASKLHAEVLRALKDHPNVFDITPEKDRKVEILGGNEIGLLVLGDTFSLRVRLPERLQKWRGLWVEESASPEEFQVLSSGSLFVAFAAIKDYPIRTNIGHEYRDLLQDQIHKATSLKSPPIGPSPIHPDIYAVFRQPLENSARSEVRTYTLGDDVIVVTDRAFGTTNEVVAGLFREFEHNLFRFYELQLDRLNLIYYDVEISNSFGDMSATVKELLKASSWRQFKLAALSSQARASLSNVHTRLVEYAAEVLAFTRRRRQFIEKIKENRFLQKISHYFADMLEAETDPPDPLYPALTYFGQELQTMGNMRSVIIASFLSAVVGAFLYALVSQLFVTHHNP